MGPLLGMLSRYWWVIALRGLFALIFGVLAFVWPDLTLTALVLLFGAYALVDGVFAIVTGVQSRGRKPRWWAGLLEGLVGVAIGTLTFLWPEVTALALLYLIAFWATLTGVLEIWAAVELRREIQGEWLLILSGLASLVLGVLLVIQPGAGAVALVWLIGSYAVLFGILLIALGFRLRSWRTATT